MDITLDVISKKNPVLPLLNVTSSSGDEVLWVWVPLGKGVTFKDFMNSETILNFLEYIVTISNFHSIYINCYDKKNSRHTAKALIHFFLSKIASSVRIATFYFTIDNIRNFFNLIYDNIDLLKKIFSKYHDYVRFNLETFNNQQTSSFGFSSERDFFYYFGEFDDFNKDIFFFKKLVDIIDFKKILNVDKEDILNFLDKASRIYTVNKIDISGYNKLPSDVITIKYNNGFEARFRYLSSNKREIDFMFDAERKLNLSEILNADEEIIKIFGSKDINYNFSYDLRYESMDNLEKFLFYKLDKFKHLNNVNVEITKSNPAIKFGNDKKMVSLLFNYKSINNEFYLKALNALTKKFQNGNFFVDFLDTGFFDDHSSIKIRDYNSNQMLVEIVKLQDIFAIDDFFSFKALNLLASNILFSKKNLLIELC